MLINLHNHTQWSDGNDSPEQIILHALEHGVQVVGITDHFNTRKCRALSCEDLVTYIAEIRHLQQKYAQEIKVLCGVEMDMDRWSMDREPKALPYELLNQLDYVLFEYVDQQYNTTCFKLFELEPFINQLTCKKGLAHTDLAYMTSLYGIKETITAMKRLHLFWELNISYEYTWNFVQAEMPKAIEAIVTELKNQDIQVTAGTDTHDLRGYDDEALRTVNHYIRERINSRSKM